VPSVGDITARTLIAELPELGTLDRRKIGSRAVVGRARDEDGLRFRMFCQRPLDGLWRDAMVQVQLLVDFRLDVDRSRGAHDQGADRGLVAVARQDHRVARP